MLLAIDVGNTNTVIGLYNGDTLVADWRMASVHTRMPDEWASTLITLMAHRGYKLADIDAAICSSVVPPLTTAMRETGRGLLQHKAPHRRARHQDRRKSNRGQPTRGRR